MEQKSRQPSISRIIASRKDTVIRHPASSSSWNTTPLPAPRASVRLAGMYQQNPTGQYYSILTPAMPLRVIPSPIQDSLGLLPCSPGFSTWTFPGIIMTLLPSSGHRTKMDQPMPGVMGWISMIQVFHPILRAGQMGFRWGASRISCKLCRVRSWPDLVIYFGFHISHFTFCAL